MIEVVVSDWNWFGVPILLLFKHDLDNTEEKGLQHQKWIDRSRQCENQRILPGLWTRAVQKLAMANWHHRLGLTCSTYLNIFQDGEILELTMWKCFPVTCVSACDLSACNPSRLTNRHWKDFACTNMCTSYVHKSRQMSNWRDMYTVWYHSKRSLFLPSIIQSNGLTQASWPSWHGVPSFENFDFSNPRSDLWWFLCQ